MRGGIYWANTPGSLSFNGTTLKCLLHGSSADPCGIESYNIPWLPSRQCTFYWFVSLPSCPTYSFVLPQVPSQINYVHSSSCLRVCLQGTHTETAVMWRQWIKYWAESKGQGRVGSQKFKTKLMATKKTQIHGQEVGLRVERPEYR